MAAFAPDLHRDFTDDADGCESDAERIAVAARWERELARERRRESRPEHERD